MKKHFILTCLVLLGALSSFGLPVITGTFGCCVGDSTTYLRVDSATSGGGTWSSSNVTVATVAARGSFYATVYGVSAGVVTITYTLGSSVATASFTITPVPAAISGITTLCAGVSAALTDATAGGTWSVGWLGTRVATIDAATGVVTGVSAGGVDIYYTVGTGCSTAAYLTIVTTATGYISAPHPMCAATPTTLTDGTSGGVWSSSNTAIATINATTGVATGVSAGTVNFSYTVTGICGLASTWDTVSVLTTTPTATLSGPTSVMVPSVITITPSVRGGTWSSSNTAAATVDGSGNVTGVSPGTTTISYSLTGCSGVVTATTIITVIPFDGISGYVNFTSAYYGPVLVWLITYNPATLDLEALDSVMITGSSGASVYYQFTGLPTDSFRVKAAVSFDTAFIPAGYIPTYHTSSYYWHDADVIYHTSGTADINENINMAAGVTLPGPGFIGGNVSTGANRGTSTGAPVPNLLVFAVNSTTGALVQQTYTNASGNYSFTGLPYGTYLVHPELINYATIDYTGITLSSGSATMSNASFIEHTVSMVISPGSESVKNVAAEPLSVMVYPNPATDELTLLWKETTNETGNISLADITGKVVYKTTIGMKAGTGNSQLGLPSLTDGIYIFTIKSANISYTGKIQILH